MSKFGNFFFGRLLGVNLCFKTLHLESSQWLQQVQWCVISRIS